MISNMDWQVIRLDDARPTPWKNGGGTTRELIAWPQTQIQAQDWKCRASVAEVNRSGPFSSFAGVQRWFAVLSGAGVGLMVNGHRHELRKTDSPFSFDGATQTDCELLGGATQDFNLMVQGGASALVHRVNKDASLKIDTPKIIAAYAVNTPATLRFGLKEYELKPNTFGWTLANMGTVVHMHATDALLMEITL